MIPIMKTFATNQEVQTPLGKAVVQARVRPQGVPVDEVHWLVRLPVNEQTAAHLVDVNCMTPKANRTALFVFPTSEIGGGLLGDMVLAALFVLGLLALGSCMGWPW